MPRTRTLVGIETVVLATTAAYFARLRMVWPWDDGDVRGPSFDPVADDYAAARPGYPDSVYAALGLLDGLDVVEGGAGPGIATRPLRERGARVIAVDVGHEVLRRSAGRRLVADAARLPLRDRCADLVCFAQAWHWLDHDVAGAESARVLRDGGRWAAWWNHPRADGEPWFEAYWDVIETQTSARRWHRDTDWGETVDAAAFLAPVRTTHEWERVVPIEEWLTDQRSHSYIGLEGRHAVLPALEAILRDAFGDGPVRCRYETWLWVATVRR
jgi:SAM-dependent methyltransferase